MENQHRQIKGYRGLNEVEIALMHKIREQGIVLQSLIEDLWLAIGKTHMQEGLMALARSIGKPEFF